jgi:hypothetical protein
VCPRRAARARARAPGTVAVLTSPIRTRSGLRTEAAEAAAAFRDGVCARRGAGRKMPIGYPTAGGSPASPEDARLNEGPCGLGAVDENVDEHPDCHAEGPHPAPARARAPARASPRLRKLPPWRSISPSRS